MRQQRSSVKQKVRDLKRVLANGLETFYESGLEAITGMFILPGNGRDDQSDGSVLVMGPEPRRRSSAGMSIAHGASKTEWLILANYRRSV